MDLSGRVGTCRRGRLRGLRRSLVSDNPPICAFNSRTNGGWRDGVPVQSDWTLAGPNWMPFGTLIYLPRLGEWFQVQDRGSLIHGHHIDLYMSSTRAALAWGSQTLRAWVLLPNAGTGS